MNNINQFHDLIEKRNNTPIVDFDGFSPAQMFFILCKPFDENSPIQFNKCISNELLFSSPIFNIIIELLNIIQKTGGIQLTQRGYIPPKIIKGIYEKKYIIDYFIEHGITKLSNETAWNLIHNIKIVLLLSNLTRKYKNNILLTKVGANSLKAADYNTIFYSFLETFTTKFNWAYNDAYESEEIGQIGFLFHLYLLFKYGNEYHKIKFYIDLYYKAFPINDNSEQQYSKYNSHEQIIITRFIMRFAEWFGFVDIDYDIQKEYLKPETMIKNTILLVEMLKIQKSI